jgi:hypothetical protein
MLSMVIQTKAGFFQCIYKSILQNNFSFRGGGEEEEEK